jgi:hypothetical protein
VLCSLQDHLRIGTRDLVSAKNTKSWYAWKGDLQRAFPLDVPMVPLSAIDVTADGEHLTCGGLSLGKIVRLRNFEFIVDYFDGLRLSPRRGDEGAAFMGSTHGGASTPRWAMIEDSVEDFLTASSMEGSFGLPSPRRRDMRTSLSPATTTPWLENALATQAMMMVLLWTVALRPETNLLFWVKSGEGDAYPDVGGSRHATKCAMVHVVHGKIEIEK